MVITTATSRLYVFEYTKKGLRSTRVFIEEREEEELEEEEEEGCWDAREFIRLKS